MKNDARLQSRDLGRLKEAGEKLKSGLEDLKSVGKADSSQIIIAFNVECLPK